MRQGKNPGALNKISVVKVGWVVYYQLVMSKCMIMSELNMTNQLTLQGIASKIKHNADIKELINFVNEKGDSSSLKFMKK